MRAARGVDGLREHARGLIGHHDDLLVADEAALAIEPCDLAQGRALVLDLAIEVGHAARLWRAAGVHTPILEAPALLELLAPERLLKLPDVVVDPEKRTAIARGLREERRGELGVEIGPHVDRALAASQRPRRIARGRQHRDLDLVEMAEQVAHHDGAALADAESRGVVLAIEEQAYLERSADRRRAPGEQGENDERGASHALEVHGDQPEQPAAALCIGQAEAVLQREIRSEEHTS